LVSYPPTNKQTNKKPPHFTLNINFRNNKHNAKFFPTCLWYDPVRDTARRVPPRPGQGGLFLVGKKDDIWDRYTHKPNLNDLGKSPYWLRGAWNEKPTERPKYLCDFCLM
jgi:hypothetical protein